MEGQACMLEKNWPATLVQNKETRKLHIKQDKRRLTVRVHVKFKRPYLSTLYNISVEGMLM